MNWIKKSYHVDGDKEQYPGTLLPSNLTAYHIFLYAFLLPAAMGSSSLSLNQMSSGSRSHDEKFMESWTHYKFYSFTAEILQVLLTYWRKKICFILLWFPNALLVCTFFLQNVYAASSNVFYITLKSREALIEGNNLVLLPVQEKTELALGRKHDQVYGSLVCLSLWLRTPYTSQWLYPNLF